MRDQINQLYQGIIGLFDCFHRSRANPFGKIIKHAAINNRPLTTCQMQKVCCRAIVLEKTAPF